MTVWPVAARAGGQLRITVVDQKSGQPVACRMHLKNSAGKTRQQRNTPNYNDHFVLNGKTVLKLPRGTYTFVIERGPEYVDIKGHFIIDDHADDEKTITLKRAVDMAAEGWWSSDLLVRRPARDMQLLMKSEDLHVAAVAVDPPGKNSGGAKIEFAAPVEFADDRALWMPAYLDQRGGNSLLLLSTAQQATTLELPAKPSLAGMLDRAAKDDLWLDFAWPFAADLPIALAAGRVNSIQLANDHQCRELVINNEGEGRRRDPKTLSGPLGNALWSQQIYYHALNCGFKIPPTAGSGSGVAPNPVGYNRVYVYTGDRLELDSWWKALRAGQATVTNGPLLRPNVRGQLPGYTFEAASGDELSLDISLSLSTRDPISYLEVIKDGVVERSVRIEDWAKSGSLAPITFKESGWFLIRAVNDVEETYRYGTTAPYYVEFANRKTRISKSSSEFFLTWARDRAQQAGKSSFTTPTDRELCSQAVKFWEDRVAAANAP